MQYIKEFLSARKLDGLAESTLSQYKLELKNLPPFLQKPSVQATTLELRSYFLQYSTKSQRTINRKISTLKAFYTWLTNEEYIERNPMKKIKTPKEPQLLPRNIGNEDFELLRWQPKSIRNQAIVELLISSGMRIGELHNLNRRDLDMNKRQIRVVGKGSKERVVFFSGIAKFYLLNYFSQRKDNEPALFVNRFEKRLSIRSIEMQLKEEAERAGIKTKVTPHILRHSFATSLYANGADIDFISRILGHSSTDTTRRYTQLDTNSMSRMYEKFMIC